MYSVPVGGVRGVWMCTVYLWGGVRGCGCEGVKERADVGIQHCSQHGDHRADEGGREECGGKVLEHSCRSMRMQYVQILMQRYSCSSK